MSSGYLGSAKALGSFCAGFFRWDKLLNKPISLFKPAAPMDEQKTKNTVPLKYFGSGEIPG